MPLSPLKMLPVRSKDARLSFETIPSALNLRSIAKNPLPVEGQRVLVSLVRSLSLHLINSSQPLVTDSLARPIDIYQADLLGRLWKVLGRGCRFGPKSECLECRAGRHHRPSIMDDRSNERQTLPIGQVTCPNCLVTMERTALGKAAAITGLRAGTYRCPRCDAETVRWIKD
jgi:hypothetical protein